MAGNTAPRPKQTPQTHRVTRTRPPRNLSQRFKYTILKVSCLKQPLQETRRSLAKVHFKGARGCCEGGRHKGIMNIWWLAGACKTFHICCGMSPKTRGRPQDYVTQRPTNHESSKSPHADSKISNSYCPCHCCRSNHFFPYDPNNGTHFFQVPCHHLKDPKTKSPDEEYKSWGVKVRRPKRRQGSPR